MNKDELMRRRNIIVNNSRMLNTLIERKPSNAYPMFLVFMMTTNKESREYMVEYLEGIMGLRKEPDIDLKMLVSKTVDIEALDSTLTLLRSFILWNLKDFDHILDQSSFKFLIDIAKLQITGLYKKIPSPSLDDPSNSEGRKASLMMVLNLIDFSIKTRDFYESDRILEIYYSELKRRNLYKPLKSYQMEQQLKK